MSLILHAVSVADRPLVETDYSRITLQQARSIYPVGSPQNIFVADDSFANSDTWAAGQGLNLIFAAPVTIRRITLDSYTNPDPGGLGCWISGNGQQLVLVPSGPRATSTWNGRLTVSVLSLGEYIRTRIYRVRIWQ